MAPLPPKSQSKQSLERSCSLHQLKAHNPLRKAVNFTLRQFDVQTLPADMLRVYESVKARFDEEYALLYIFNMQTAMEMHRAWNMTLLTAKTLKQCSETLKLNMHWNLGVIHLKFFIEDGQYELQRKCPYDYDSEFQDYYMKIATALYHGHLTVHEALIFQQETKQGKHTAKTGLFLRTYPGRLVLLPAMSATCAVIFFGGRAQDAAVAALCGLVCGLFAYGLQLVGGEATMLEDLFVGSMTGAIGGLFYRFHDQTYCLSAIFLGTMYWFFYGTAFVLGLLEILAGELETGVTRFMAVSIKTFVLCLMACFGMLMVLDKPAQVWVEQNENCGLIDLDSEWWRVPLYLACSCSVLGQYRFRMQEYWRGLIVQLVGYEVQWQVSKFFQERNANSKDLLDVMASNIAGSASALVTAVALSMTVDFVNRRYYGQLLQRSAHRDETPSVVDDVVYAVIAKTVRCLNLIGLGRKAEQEEIDLEKKLYEQTKELKDPNHPRQEIRLENHEEELLLDTVVNAESMNVWSMLMPAVYQLVPGSMIAKFWFEAIIPPEDNSGDNMFAGLMVTSLSLALGLVIGDAIVVTIGRLAGYKQEEEELLLEEQPEEDKLEKNGKVAEDELVEVEVLKGDGEWQVDEW
mmetsp:Transcript_59870/g.134478  ORF Transcript_59870/g.134478 Transcript_59870/m.134478 type:complete len:632 (-) Transcript_59870:122-2017(-)